MKNNEQPELKESKYGQGSGKKLVRNDLLSIKTHINNILKTSSLKEVSDLIMDEAKN